MTPKERHAMALWHVRELSRTCYRLCLLVRDAGESGDVTEITPAVLDDVCWLLENLDPLYKRFRDELLAPDRERP